MCWKKKAKPDPNLKRVKIPEDSRFAYRIHPSELDPIFLESGNLSLVVSDISSGGVSFVSKGQRTNQKLKVRFTLPNHMEEIFAEIEVLRVSDANICHSRFVGLPPDKEDKIHRYVLERQKEDLQF